MISHPLYIADSETIGIYRRLPTAQHLQFCVSTAHPKLDIDLGFSISTLSDFSDYSIVIILLPYFINSTIF